MAQETNASTNANDASAAPVVASVRNDHGHDAHKGNLNGHANGNGKLGGEDEEHTPLENLVAVSATVLLQAADLVSNVLEDDAQLMYVSKYIPGSTIGKHLRHARDHFALLLDSVEAHPGFSTLSPTPPPPSAASSSSAAAASDSQSNASEISATSTIAGAPAAELCYDVRARGTPMEGSRSAARTELEHQVKRLHALVDAARRAAGHAHGLKPGVDAVQGESRSRMDAPVMLSAVTPHLLTFGSSFGRELWFAALHAVHHWSMIRVVSGELNIQLDEKFGIAPSTLVYHGTEGPLGKSKI